MSNDLILRGIREAVEARFLSGIKLCGHTDVTVFAVSPDTPDGARLLAAMPTPIESPPPDPAEARTRYETFAMSREHAHGLLARVIPLATAFVADAPHGSNFYVVKLDPDGFQVVACPVPQRTD